MMPVCDTITGLALAVEVEPTTTLVLAFPVPIMNSTIIGSPVKCGWDRRPPPASTSKNQSAHQSLSGSLPLSIWVPAASGGSTPPATESRGGWRLGDANACYAGGSRVRTLGSGEKRTSRVGKRWTGRARTQRVRAVRPRPVATTRFHSIGPPEPRAPGCFHSKQLARSGHTRSQPVGSRVRAFWLGAPAFDGHELCPLSCANNDRCRRDVLRP